MRTPPTSVSARIRLCGALTFELGGRDVVLRGHQARLVVAFLTWNRDRAVSRDELIELLWPANPPADPGALLRPVLSKVRSSLGTGTLHGVRELTLALGDSAWIDVEAARADLQRTEAAFERQAWLDVRRTGEAVLEATAGSFLLADEHPWIEERRRDVEELRMSATELIGTAELALGGSGIGAAERYARELVNASPFRESGHLLLMQALTARGDVAEALRVYEALRVRLRDELGTSPGPGLRELHARLLLEDHGPPHAAARDERKLVTVVACDGPAERLEGTVVAGGGTVGVFGIPRAHEDDAERAVRAALALGGRAAVISGDVLVRHGEPVGDPIERAAALLRAAPAGAVLVDEFTAHLTEHVIDYEPVGAAFRPRGPLARAAGARTSFVGREYELTVLGRLHDAVVEEQRPRLVVIVGDAGAGKSRLVDELLRQIGGKRPSASTHGGRCLAYGDGLTYWPLRELLWSISGIGLGDSAAAAAVKLRALVDRTVAEPERTAYALAVSAGIALPDNPLDDLEPESVAEEVALAWPRFAAGLAARSPAVLVVEDLHWAEPALLDMIEQLVARSSGPLLVIATARPELLEARPRWGRTASQLAIESLTADEAQRLVAELLPGAEPELHKRIAEAADGNPFFAEEIARHLLDHGGELLSGVPIPTTVRAVLAARVDALPAAEKRALQDASVVGRSFWASSLPATGPAALRALEDRGLVVTRPTSSLPGETELWFRHALIREVAYRSIPEPQLHEAHAHAGDWLARLAGDRREEFVELLAHHYERAAAEDEARRSQAVVALLGAGEAARRRAAAGDAVQFADRALALARTGPARVEALELKARALHGALHSDGAFSAYLDALALTDDEATAARLRAHAVLLCAMYSGAFTHGWWKPWMTATLDAAPHDDGGFEAAAMLIGRASMTRWPDVVLARDLAVREAAERAIAIGEAIGSTRLVSHGLEALSWHDADTGFCDADAAADRMLAVMGRMNDRVEASETAVEAAIRLVHAGRFEEAAATACDAADITRGMSGHRRLHAVAGQTVCLSVQGRLAELADAADDAVDLALEEGERACMKVSLALAGHALARFEALDAAAGARAAELVDGTRAFHAGSWSYRSIELLRPFVGLEHTRRRLELADAPRGLVEDVYRLRATLQLAALADEESIGPLAASARALARHACALPLAWLADWAEAVRDGSLERALAATAALDAYGEHYAAARLAVDALARMPDPDAAATTAAKLERMGARASAAELTR